MRNKRAKTLRRMLRGYGLGGEPGPLMGDNRTVRYFWHVSVLDEVSNAVVHRHVVKTTTEDMPAPMAVPLVATFTLMRQPNDPRRIYQRLKREVRHGQTR